MNRLTYLFLVIGHVIWSQSAFYNAGGLGLHGNAQIGFHTDWINEGNFVTNDGLIGFYGDDPIQVSGTSEPRIYDAEVFLPNGLFLRVPINITNNFNFIEGNVGSSLNEQTIYLNFEQDAFFTGEDDPSKVTWFAAIQNKSTFSFPVGDLQLLRPLLLNSDTDNELALCAYFFENPSNPSSLNETFNIEQKVRDIGEISNQEFWVLQTDVPSTVTISWNPRSNLASLANVVDDIILVGWSKSSAQWIAIGNSSISGDLEQGFLISEKFVPNDFAAITFGTIPLPTDTFAVNNPTLGNYFISPNGDGTNDSLVFDELENAGDNLVIIYNKFGQKVFQLLNYNNEFNGFSNIDNFVVNRDIGLPEGIYYYIIDLPEENLQYQGFFFLDR